MKKFFLRILIILVILVAVLFTFSIINKESYFEEKEVKYSLGDQIKYQDKVDKQLSEYIIDTRYTIENPKIVVNPYGLTPLTAIIIFNTQYSTDIKVEINGKYFTTMEESTLHSIPIYGMYAGTDNKIKLTDNLNNSYEYTITTESYEGDLLKIENTSEKLDDSLYFISPNFVENCIYDKEGNLLWYIKGDYAGDIEYLENGHFYISDPYQGTNGIKINYAGFLEMDYLGKIYKQYITQYGYHHEIVQLDNNKILTTGTNDNSNFLEAVLYTMDLETGKIEKSIDMYEFLHKISPEWIESLGNNFDFVLNSIYYDKPTGDVVISCRGIGTIIRFNFETEEIKWMFGDPDYLPDEFDKYLLKVIDDTKYPYGEHCAFLTKEGYLAFHNNDANQFNMKSQKLSDYIDKYTTNVKLEIDEEKRTIKTVWEYEADKKEFSKVGGYLEFLENGNTLINYGWSIKEEAYKNPDNISIEDTEYLNGVVIELDSENNVLFRASMDGLIYRVSKIRLYEEITANYKIIPYELIEQIPNNVQKISTKKIKKELKNAEEYKYDFDVQIDRVMITYPITKEDKVDVIFVQENESYIFEYKEKGEEVKKDFNSQKYGKLISIPKGEYAVYVCINGEYFDTNIVERFFIND